MKTEPVALFGPEPARDARFAVRRRWQELSNFPDEDPRREFEFLHRQMHEEITGLENSARCLADFPEADWDLRMQMARQCADEARHVEMFRNLFEKRGGHVGQFPVTNFQYRIISRLDSLVARLAVQNRSFEADGIDAIRHAIDTAQASGDDELAALFDAQLADEINHVRFANEWVRTLVSRSPRLAMNIARALHEASIAFEWAMEGGHAVDYQVDRAVRSEAGFADDEIALAHELAEAVRRPQAAMP
jgi:uncharacterized ferritin-like protein (DUF455 family)